jgi:RHS repeat-associated protein
VGTTSLVLDANGNKVAESRHYPYGVERWSSGTLPTDYRFTGQRFDSGLGIYAMEVRWYDPSLGRWLSADTLVPDPASPQGFNRYSYTRNNPLNFVDPTGHKEEGECGPNGEDCIDVSALWDQFWLQYVGDPRAAEEAFLLFLNDPQHFAALYADPAAWNASQEVANLDVFLQYSVLHTTAASVISAGFDDDVASNLWTAHVLHGMGDGAGANDLLTAAGFGVPAIASAVFIGGSHSGPPNPWGSPGNPAHQAAVSQLEQMARAEFGPEAELRFNRSIFRATGLNRRPDVSVWRNNQLLKVYEAARVDQSGNSVPREQIKMYEYYEYGIPYYFGKVQR